MTLRRLGLALALATLPCAYASAQSTIEAPTNSGQRFPGTIAIDPTTGKPATPPAGYTGAPATAPGTNGATATPVQGVDGGKPVAVSGKVDQGAAGTTPWLTTLYQGGAALSASNPIFAQVTGIVTANIGATNGLALDTSSQAIKTALGSPFQAGGSIANTGFNALQAGAANTSSNPFFVTVTNSNAAASTVTSNQGTPAPVANAWPHYLAQGGAALSASNPIFDQVTNFPTGFNALQGGVALSPTNVLPTATYTPNAAVSGRTITKTALNASQNTSVCPAPTVPLQSTEVQISVAAVGLGFNGQTLSSASYGTATSNPDYITPAAGTLYTFPVPPTNAVSAYSANAAVVICIQTARQ